MTQNLFLDLYNDPAFQLLCFQKEIEEKSVRETEYPFDRTGSLVNYAWKYYFIEKGLEVENVFTVFEVVFLIRNKILNKDISEYSLEFTGKLEKEYQDFRKITSQKNG